MKKPPRSSPPPVADPHTDQPLREQIHLLGRLLGDVIRTQEGAKAYELVERVRQLSVRFRRDADAESERAMKKLLRALSTDQMVSVIRAFTYFSHLANLAEDRHHIRRRDLHDRLGHVHEGGLPHTLRRLKGAGVSPRALAAMLAAAQV